jgi:hypothetical protein
MMIEYFSNFKYQKCVTHTREIPNFSGHGKPLNYLTTRRTTVVDPNIMPTADEANAMYADAGGYLTQEHNVGTDLLDNLPILIQRREDIFWNQIRQLDENTTISYLFSCTVNHSYIPLQRAILLHIYLSEQLYYAV